MTVPKWLRYGGVLILVLVGVAQSSRASVHRGQAEVWRETALARGARGDSLAAERDAALAVAATMDSAVARIGRQREEGRRQAMIDSARLTSRIAELGRRVEGLTAAITPEVLELVQPLLDAKDEQIQALDSAVVLERSEKLAERARADSLEIWGGSWEDVAENALSELDVRGEQIAALEAANASLESAIAGQGWAFLPEPEWWMVAAAAVGGFVYGELR